MKFTHSKNCGHTCPCDRRPEWRICGRFRKAKGATGSGAKQHRCHGGHSAVAVNAGVKIPTSGLGGLIRRRVRAGTG